MLYGKVLKKEVLGRYPEMPLNCFVCIKVTVESTNEMTIQTKFVSFGVAYGQFCYG
jgi:hypothetical protein